MGYSSRSGFWRQQGARIRPHRIWAEPERRPAAPTFRRRCDLVPSAPRDPRAPQRLISELQTDPESAEPAHQEDQARRRWTGAPTCSASTWPASARPPPRSSPLSAPTASESGAPAARTPTHRRHAGRLVSKSLIALGFLAQSALPRRSPVWAASALSAATPARWRRPRWRRPGDAGRGDHHQGGGDTRLDGPDPGVRPLRRSPM